ncbi:cyclic-di-AMP-binding protein CbpB [Gracilibacillus sp. S3-1-1]|uniref:Cyclic-di-AMP-binding protein CbpB n=1 Tax=Gracilibacillus pellucidus TaxID=3095368 RepID=A0ACC6M1X5_9BACI|nr:cyclic-di-AMP-binding protein CbpB [Gracilibacillus sp. S3-1-1]MDX8044867.1 cyclic-di-AMP-binding protein CbpB [Gracilibacillus sp. S3-1-1]
MTSLLNKTLTALTVEELMIPAEKVAHVQVGNPVEHALLVLVESGYSSVPVLDLNYKFKGTIGKTPILKSVIGMERFEMEKLSDIKVEDVMKAEQPTVTKETDFLTCLKVVINHAFACVVDEDGYFLGILTRRAILKEVNKSLYN